MDPCLAEAGSCYYLKNLTLIDMHLIHERIKLRGEDVVDLNLTCLRKDLINLGIRISGVASVVVDL